MERQGDGCGTWIVLGLVVFGLWKCNGRSEEAKYPAGSPSEYGDLASSDYETFGDYAEDRREEAEQERAYELAGTDYEYESYAYGCTQDCSGHQAGWDWAADNGITSPYDCGGTSQSFTEGCMAYAEEVEAAGEEAAEGGYY